MEKRKKKRKNEMGKINNSKKKTKETTRKEIN